ncbi:DMT family transporter [Thermoplasma sp.]|uniref:DMT family transporter n=1 Tax=Thermoplasma sp. TaxID=1973142 RepID=UPI00127228A3|nr:DMT family transporter [Thermoplasma sp.]KAA8923032.1 MAG: DMT family transporter [Thermoplasma sp.]
MKEIKYLIPYVIISSFSYYFAKNGVEQVSPAIFMSMRYFIAGLTLLPFARHMKLSWNVVILSIMTSTSTALWAYGLVYVSPAESAILSYSMPVFSLPIAFLMIKEKSSAIETAGIAIGFAGIIIYGLPLMHGFTLFGAVLTIANAVFWALFTVFYRKLKEEDPVSINTMQFFIGGVILLAYIPLDTKFDPGVSFIADVLWMAILGGSIQFILWNMMIKMSSVNKITVLAFSVPIFTMILSIFIDHEVPDIMEIVGVITMFTGIFISRLKRGISIVRETSS